MCQTWNLEKLTEHVRHVVAAVQTIAVIAKYPEWSRLGILALSKIDSATFTNRLVHHTHVARRATARLITSLRMTRALAPSGVATVSTPSATSAWSTPCNWEKSSCQNLNESVLFSKRRSHVDQLETRRITCGIHGSCCSVYSDKFSVTIFPMPWAQLITE